MNDNPHAKAGPSRRVKLPRKSKIPFISADNRPNEPDGFFRVVIISTGSVASIKIPEIVGALSRDDRIAIQVVSTTASRHFYTQEQVDEAVRRGVEINESTSHDPFESDDTIGVRMWTDADEWSHWHKVGDPILHIELRRWADLVVIAPCSADMLAKIAGGHCDNLALSLLRALPSSTPVILYPAMNTAMYSHKFTNKHLKVVKEELGYEVIGPQGTGKLACGDEGPGKMTDWREIVSDVLDHATSFLGDNGKEMIGGQDSKRTTSLHDMREVIVER